MNMEILAIIVNYFTSELCQKAVKSVISQNVKTKVVVVDNSCDLKERENLLSLRRELGDSFELIFPSYNLGFAKACNLAFKRHDNCKYILLLNPDAHLLKGALEPLKSFLDKEPMAGAVAPRIFLDDARKIFMPPMPNIELKDLLLRQIAGGFFLKWQIRSYLKEAIEYWMAKRPIIQEMLSGSIVLIRQKAVREIGGLFDEQFFMYYEDTDLFKRLKKKGWKLFMLPESHAVHRYDKSPRNKKAEYFSESQSYFFKKYYPFLPKKIVQILIKEVQTEFFSFFKKSEDPVSIRVPSNIKNSNYFFVFSPNAPLIPCAGIYGKDEIFTFPKEGWDVLEEGQKFFYDFITVPQDFN